MRKHLPSQTGFLVAAAMLAASIGQACSQTKALQPVRSPFESVSSGEILPDLPLIAAISDSESATSAVVSGPAAVAISGAGSRRAPSADERFHRFLKRSLSPSALRDNLLDAAQAQFQKEWPAYGSGIDGFERRYGAVSAGHIAGSFFNTYLFPSLLHQDPRSPRMGPGNSVWHRMEYAVSRAAMTRGDSGRQTFNSSLLLSTAASSVVADLYLPRDQRGVSPVFQRIGSSLTDNVEHNLSSEFLPDIQRFVLNHIPSRMRKFAERLPIAKQ